MKINKKGKHELNRDCTLKKDKKEINKKMFNQIIV